MAKKKFMQKEFTKADLKDGMIVETREKGKYIVLGNMFLNSNGHNRLDEYTDELKENEYNMEEYDVVKVFKIKNNCVSNIKYLFENKNLELIWERTETKHMTAEEMRVKLEELTGEKIEIEPSREEMVGACYEYCRNYPVMFCNSCPLREVENCNFVELTNEELKQCYEKVIANGK